MCTKCQKNDCGCSKKTVEYKICGECLPQPACDCPVVDLSTNCSIFTGDDLSCSGIKKGTILTDLIVQLDAYICTAIAQLNASLNLINVGEGAKIYKGIDGLGRRQLRTIVGSDSVIVTEESNIITLDVDLSGLELSPLQSIDEGNGLGTIIRYRDEDNFGSVGFGAMDFSKSDDVSTDRGARGQYSTIGNGLNQIIGVSAEASIIGAGRGNEIQARLSGIFSGSSNLIDENNESSVIGGGQGNEITGGLFLNSNSNGIFSGNANSIVGLFSVIGGGDSNKILTSAQYSAILGGLRNEIYGYQSFIGGGYQNKTRINNSAVLGGSNNDAVGEGAQVVGNSAVANSFEEIALGSWGTIYVPASTTAFNITDRQLNIGIGQSTGRKDGFSLFKNGLATLPTVTNAIITAGSGKSIVTKEYLVSQLPTIDGSETKVNAGTNISVSGNGTIATPYVINSTFSVDGSETKINSGTTTVVTGNGTIATPYVIETVNLQKAITADYTLLASDNNYSIKVNNGATPVTITVPAGLPSNFFVGITQKGTADVTFVGSGTTITNPVGLKIKGQGYCVGLEQIGLSNTYDLLADTKA